MRKSFALVCLIISIIFLSCDLGEYHLKRGIQYEKDNNLESARKEYFKSIQNDSTFLEAYKKIGNIDQMNRRYYWAIFYYNRYIDKFGFDSETLLNRSTSKIEIGDYIGALTDINMIINKIPKSGFSYYKRAVIEFTFLRETDKAKADCENAIKYGYKNANVYSLKGNSYFVKGNLTDALKDFMLAIKIDSTNLTGYLNAISVNQTSASIVESRGKKEDAYYFDMHSLRLLNDAIRIIPGNKDLYESRGNLYVKYHDFARAILDFEEAYKLSPKNTELLFSIGICKIDNGEKQNGISDINKAASLGSRQAEEFLKNFGEQ